MATSPTRIFQARCENALLWHADPRCVKMERPVRRLRGSGAYCRCEGWVAAGVLVAPNADPTSALLLAVFQMAQEGFQWRLLKALTIGPKGWSDVVDRLCLSCTCHFA